LVVSRKIGRNDLCWCGSGLKYKRCHLNRESEEILKPWDAEGQLKKNFSKKLCSVPPDLLSDCKGIIVRAHTVPKSSSLQKICRDGHVYSFVPSFKNLTKNNGLLAPELRGINQASTFTGFCGHHDNSVFAPVESVGFTGTPQQCFLLAYRALARECYTKNSLSSMMSLIKTSDKGRKIDQQQAIQDFAKLFGEGVDAGVGDNQLHKDLYDALLLSQDFSSVRSFLIFFRDPPEIMCSGCLFPVEDFEGEQLQNLSDLNTVAKMISFSSFWTGSCGAVVFTWLGDSDSVCIPFITSLETKSDAEISNCLTRFFFEVCENIHLKPEWWEGLGAGPQGALVRRMSNSANPFQLQKRNPLKDDGLKYANWKVQSRSRIGF
jgi:hypothetical protein